MMAQHSIEISPHDLEGSVKNLIDELKNYPEDAQITIGQEPVYGYGGWTDEIQTIIFIKWQE